MTDTILLSKVREKRYSYGEKILKRVRQFLLSRTPEEKPDELKDSILYSTSVGAGLSGYSA